jgi:ligand-binding sensor domain-containing protein
MTSWLIKYFLILVFLALSNVLPAQTTGIRRFKINEGSDPTKILTIYKNNQGYIYAGTVKGLYKFDGTKFTLVPFKNPVDTPAVTSIFQDNNNQLWVGLQTGDIAKLVNNQLKFFTPEEGTPKKPITAFLQDRKNNIWFATDGEGIFYITNNHQYNINSSDGLGRGKSESSVYSLTLSDDEEVLAGSDQGINICKIFGANKKVSNINSKDGLPDNFIKTIIPAGSNSYWIGMQDKGLCLFNNNTRQFTIMPVLASWKFGQVNKLLQSQHYLWIATEDNGIIKADVSAKGINHLIIEHDLPLNINDLLQDNEGNIWVLANNTELIKTPGDQLKILVNYKEKDFQNVHAILSDNNNNVWQGTTRGVVKHLSNDTSKHQRKYTINELDVKTDITALYQDNYNRIWIGTMGKGIFLLDENTGRYRRVDENILLQKSSVLSITGNGNTVFVSSLEGAGSFTLGNDASINGKFNYNNFTNISSIGSNYIYDIFKDSKGNTWFATDGRGITVLRNGVFTNYNESHGLKDEVIYSIAEDIKGNIWFSTHSAGVYKFDGKKFTNYSTANGLSDINISAVKIDKAGNILIVYKKGIDVLDPITNQVSYINGSQGINEINVQDLGTVSQDTSGGILVSTLDGILYYRPLPNALHRPQTILENASLFLDPIDINKKHSFSYDQNSFLFSFIGIYYTDPESVNYQYQLDGLSNEWIPTKDRSITFPKLPPGKYTFRVRSSINQIFDNTTEASYEFVIEKPFWTAWWFIVSAILITGALVYWYVKAREKSVKKVERLQQEKIQFQFETLRNQVNPHFLFNSFNTLISIIEENPKMAVEYVEQLSDFFRNIVNYRDKDVIALKEEIELLKTYFFIQQKRFGNNLSLNINLSDQQKNESFIPPLTLQLLGENAIKHNAVSKETPLCIDIFMEAERLIIRNNINVKYSKSSGAGMGLQNIINRYTLLSNQEVIINQDNQFFTVSLPVLKQKV